MRRDSLSRVGVSLIGFGFGLSFLDKVTKGGTLTSQFSVLIRQFSNKFNGSEQNENIDQDVEAEMEAWCFAQCDMGLIDLGFGLQPLFHRTPMILQTLAAQTLCQAIMVETASSTLDRSSP